MTLASNLPSEQWWIFKDQAKIVLRTNFSVAMMDSTLETTRSLAAHLQIERKEKCRMKNFGQFLVILGVGSPPWPPRAPL
jgi:hypothetical protein